MRQWIRSHLTYANVVATLSLFLVLGGGTALASYVISSNSQVGPGTISGHKPPSGDQANIIRGSINGSDISDRSGVDTCGPRTAKYGPICVGPDGAGRSWSDSLRFCAYFGFRLPTLSEAIALATNHDVPGVTDTQSFWTDEVSSFEGADTAAVVYDNGSWGDANQANQVDATVCVTDPSA